jgi:hypothetical protein
VPIDVITHDLCQLHLGTNEYSDVQYTMTGPETDRTKLLYRRVYELKHKNIMPNGQMLLPL